MIKAVLFDLDGTLLPLDEEEFTKVYFGLLCKKICPLGFDKQELVSVIWKCTYAMIKNDGKVTNDVVFWENFKTLYGDRASGLAPIFDRFYEEEYLQTASCVKENPFARDIMDFLKENNIKSVLASRPIFPKNGMVNRAKFVGLKEEDFCFITSYDACSYSKPNPKYYEEILAKLGLQPSEVLMFGNNEKEDGVAQSVGIKTYLVDTGYLIWDNKQSNLPIIDIKDVISTIKTHL